MPHSLSLAPPPASEPSAPSSHTAQTAAPISGVEVSASEKPATSGLSDIRRRGRAAFSRIVSIAIATTTSQEALARALRMRSRSIVSRWVDPDDDLSMSGGDIYAAALAGRVDFARSVATQMLAAIDALASERARVASVERQAWGVAREANSLVGSLLSKLEDGVLTRDELHSLAPELRALGRGVEALLRAVEVAR